MAIIYQDPWSVHSIGYGPLTDWIKGRIHSRNNGLSQSEKRIASLRITMLREFATARRNHVLVVSRSR
jgi:hypothetical protein